MFRTLKLKLFGRYKIPGTTVKANLFKQREHIKKGGLSYHTSYYDEEIICRDCIKLFIYTAEEKKNYYEELKGNIYAIGVRCKNCRKIKKDEKQRQKAHMEKNNA